MCLVLLATKAYTWCTLKANRTPWSISSSSSGPPLITSSSEETRFRYFIANFTDWSLICASQPSSVLNLGTYFSVECSDNILNLQRDARSNSTFTRNSFGFGKWSGVETEAQYGATNRYSTVVDLQLQAPLRMQIHAWGTTKYFFKAFSFMNRRMTNEARSTPEHAVDTSGARHATTHHGP
jgi:hypothetical protein